MKKNGKIMILMANIRLIIFSQILVRCSPPPYSQEMYENFVRKQQNTRSINAASKTMECLEQNIDTNSCRIANVSYEEIGIANVVLGYSNSPDRKQYADSSRPTTSSDEDIKNNNTGKDYFNGFSDRIRPKASNFEEDKIYQANDDLSLYDTNVSRIGFDTDLSTDRNKPILNKRVCRKRPRQIIKP